MENSLEGKLGELIPDENMRISLSQSHKANKKHSIKPILYSTLFLCLSGMPVYVGYNTDPKDVENIINEISEYDISDYGGNVLNKATGYIVNALDELANPEQPKNRVQIKL